MKFYFIIILIVIIAISGTLSVVSIAITGANSFTRTQRKKHPYLKWIDGKQILLFIIAIISTIIFFMASGLKEITTMISSSESETKQNMDYPQKNQNIQSEVTNSNEVINSNKVIVNNENYNGNKVIQSSEQNKTQIPITNPNSKANTIINIGTSINSSKNINEKNSIKPQSLAKAKSLLSQSKYNEAIRECDKILRINPNNSEALSLKNWATKQLAILNQ